MLKSPACCACASIAKQNAAIATRIVSPFDEMARLIFISTSKGLALKPLYDICEVFRQKGPWIGVNSILKTESRVAKRLDEGAPLCTSIPNRRGRWQAPRCAIHVFRSAAALRRPSRCEVRQPTCAAVPRRRPCGWTLLDHARLGSYSGGDNSDDGDVAVSPLAGDRHSGAGTRSAKMRAAPRPSSFSRPSKSRATASESNCAAPIANNA